MGIVVSLMLFAVGAIMRYAVTVEGDGFDVGKTGVILMIVGAVGAVLSMINWATWGGVGPGRRPTTTTTVRETEVD